MCAIYTISVCAHVCDTMCARVRMCLCVFVGVRAYSTPFVCWCVVQCDSVCLCPLIHCLRYREKENIYSHILISRILNVLSVKSLLTTITPKNLDVLDIFDGHKKVHLAFNGNPTFMLRCVIEPKSWIFWYRP